MLDPEALERVIELMVAAETIYILGQRRSFPIAAYLAYAFAKIGVRAVLVDNVGSMASEMLRFAGPADAALAVSFTPYAPVTVDLARDLSARKVPIAALTDSAFSPLTQISTAWVEIVEADFGGFRSVAATFVLAITIAVAVGERRGSAG